MFSGEIIDVLLDLTSEQFKHVYAMYEVPCSSLFLTFF